MSCINVFANLKLFRWNKDIHAPQSVLSFLIHRLLFRATLHSMKNWLHCDCDCDQSLSWTAPPRVSTPPKAWTHKQIKIRIVSFVLHLFYLSITSSLLSFLTQGSWYDKWMGWESWSFVARSSGRTLLIYTYMYNKWNIYLKEIIYLLLRKVIYTVYYTAFERGDHLVAAED